MLQVSFTLTIQGNNKKSMSRSSVITFAILNIFIRTSLCDYYSSVSQLGNLIFFESQLVEYFENYVKRVEATQNVIERFLNASEAEETNKNLKHFGNPVNLFHITKRLSIDWRNLEQLVFDTRDYEEYTKNISTLSETQHLVKPDAEDLQGASKGLVRLQITYALNTEEVAQGELMEMKFSNELSASDCFQLGRSLYDVGEYQYAVEWLMQARIHWWKEMAARNNTYEFPYLTDVQILEFLAPSMSLIGMEQFAVILNAELLKLDAANTYALQNIELYEGRAVESRRPNLLDNSSLNMLQKINLDELYRKTCRGELHQTPSEQRNLHCRYVCRQEVPFCRLAPFKMEELNHDPLILFYHEAIYDIEIEQIFITTEDRLIRSKVGDTNDSRISDIRTSKNTWLDFEQHTFVRNLAQRLVDITGLELKTGEPLQVANYGIGGHYGPHWDFIERPEQMFKKNGNRIATALFYINDVELGGATAFPLLRLAVPPVRRSLVFWYNMHESLELDYRTKHAGCPVLVGSKWICNEWFHEIGQEFNRPCSLTETGNISKPYKDVN